MIFILPINIQLVNKKDRGDLLDKADVKFTDYINKITGQTLSSPKDSLTFLEDFQKPEELFKKIIEPTLLPIQLRDLNSLSEFITSFRDTGGYTPFKDRSIGWNFGLYIQSQFIRVQEHRFFCEKLIAEPIYDYELPWFFFNYEMGCGGIDEAIINSMQKEKFEWISNIPIYALKILREENKLEYMRNTLRKGITDLKAKNDSDLLKVSEQIEYNFQEAFKQQKSEIVSLEKEVANIAKKEIPITAGGFLLGFVPILGDIISFLTAGRDIKNLLDQRSKNKKEIAIKKNAFINLLMQSHDNR